MFLVVRIILDAMMQNQYIVGGLSAYRYILRYCKMDTRVQSRSHQLHAKGIYMLKALKNSTNIIILYVHNLLIFICSIYSFTFTSLFFMTLLVLIKLYFV